jgi:hypothetical protein
MNERTQDRLFAACGIASVVLDQAGASISSAGGSIISLTLSSSPAQVADALAKPADSLVWVGAYIQLLSFGAFLAFAAWAARKLGGGLLGQVMRAAGTSYATLSIASLCVLDAIEYRAGHGMSAQLATALHTVNEALFVGTWFLTVFFLLAAAALALPSGRRALGWSAVGVALITLVATALAVDVISIMLWSVWIVFAGIALARGERTPTRAAAIARSA